jgi:enoyl-CoA hydratase/carnithine racemase
VVPTGQQVPAALAMAREMTEFSPQVLKTLKRFVTETVLSRGPSEQQGRALRELNAVRESVDAAEATAAVKEKRKPRYQDW